MKPLDLADPQWKELKGTYSDGAKVATQLADLKAKRLSKEGEDHLWQELCHEYESTQAGYAAIPHLVEIAEQADGERALFLLAMAGHVLSCAQRSASQRIPDFLRQTIDAATTHALKRLGELLDGQITPSSVNAKALAFTIAAFMGDAHLYFDIEGLDCGINCPKCGHHFSPDRFLGSQDSEN